jgi:phage terminase small subunit
MSLPEEALGPKMQALWDDRVRRFAWLIACGEKSASKAAKEAGYSDSSEAAKVTAHRLMHNAAVLDAIEETGRRVLRGLAPMAIRSAKEILGDKTHPQHARMIETVLDRTGFFAETKHSVAVTHSVDTKELETLARRLAVENGIDPRRFLGGPVDKVIDGEATEVVPE